MKNKVQKVTECVNCQKYEEANMRYRTAFKKILTLLEETTRTLKEMLWNN